MKAVDYSMTLALACLESLSVAVSSSLFALGRARPCRTRISGSVTTGGAVPPPPFLDKRNGMVKADFDGR